MSELLPSEDCTMARLNNALFAEQWDRLTEILGIQKCSVMETVDEVERRLSSAERSGIERAAKALIDKLNAIHADPRYQSVWQIAMIHAGNYSGPNYEAELKQLTSALALLPADAPQEEAPSKIIQFTGITFDSDCVWNGQEIKAGTEIKFTSPVEFGSLRAHLGAGGGKMRFKTFDEVDDAKQEIGFAVDALLRTKGWEYTCDTPGSYWLWSRKLSDGRTLLVGRDTAISIQGAFDSGVYTP